MRVNQPEGQHGSLKWIQKSINGARPDIFIPVLEKTGAAAIEWRSPLASDDFAEYRDAAFLDRLGLASLSADLAGFWPSRGPQWDALGRTDRDDILLVEAKAHVGELCSPATQASAVSRARIEDRLSAVATALHARPGHAPWTDHFYQLANRIAHLWWLRERGIAAWLVLVNFLGDSDMRGPSSASEWQAAYQVAWHVMGLDRRHPLSHFIIEIFPSVEQLQ